MDKGKIKDIMSTLLAIVIGLALTPVVGTAATDAAENLTGAAATLVGLVPLFWVVIVLAIGASAVYAQLQ